MNIAAIFSGGSGVRMGAGVPKQFLQVNGKPILVHTLELFQYHDQIDKIYISVIEEYIDYVWDLVEEYHLTKVCGVMAGEKPLRIPSTMPSRPLRQKTNRTPLCCCTTAFARLFHMKQFKTTLRV